MTDTDILYMAALEKRLEIAEAENTELKAHIAELESKHWNECGQIAHYDDELRKAKRLLKAAVEDFHDVLTSQIKITNHTLCQKCKYYLNCNCKDKCLARYDLKQWRYADEAFALIGEDGDAE